MEALLASLTAYLAIALDTGRNVDVADGQQGIQAQIRVAGMVLATGLLWPRQYWHMLKKDWNNYFLD